MAEKKEYRSAIRSRRLIRAALLQSTLDRMEQEISAYAAE